MGLCLTADPARRVVDTGIGCGIRSGLAQRALTYVWIVEPDAMSLSAEIALAIPDLLPGLVYSTVTVIPWMLWLERDRAPRP